jgi:hypothetical protein
MHRPLILLAALAIAVNVYAASDFTVTPHIGSVIGFDNITLHLNLPLVCAACALPPSADVAFGGARGRNPQIVDRFTITVTTPAAQAGVVDVVVQAGGLRLTATNAFTFSGWGGLIARENYEAVLIPISIAPDTPIPGANGSRWITELWVRNAASHAVEFFYGLPDCVGNCTGNVPFPYITPATSAAQPGGVTDGTLAYVQRGSADTFTMSMRVRDVSRTGENAGTDIPLVREDDFSSTPIELLNVPIDSLSRTGLRVYDTDAKSETTATVRIMPMTGDTTPIVTTTMTLTPRDTAQRGFLRLASYAFISDLRTAFPQVPEGRYRIEVTPVKFTGWAFASSTNNDTQLVTTVTPQ